MAQGLVFNLTLPCAIILSFATNKHDMHMLWIVLFGFCACTIPLLIMFDIGNAIVTAARHAGAQHSSRFFSSISFDIHMLMLVFMFLHITIPQPIVTLITPFANANAFCAMAMIGLMMEIPNNRKDKVELGKVIVWRMVFGAIIAVAAWFLLPFDMRIREIIVLGSFAPITIFSTKFTDSLTGNAKLAGFSLTVTAIISLVVMTALHALLPGA